MITPVRHLASCLLLVVALLLIGCGDGEEDGTVAPESAPSAAAPTQGGSKAGEGEPSRGGEASIEDFGEEAEGSERAAILDAFSAYLNALAGKEYAAACSYLAASVHSSLRQFVPAPLKAKGCPALLPRLLAPTAPAIAREQAEGKIAKVRIDADRAFVVFHAPGAKLYQLPMAREDGGWKSTLVAASVLVPDL